MTVYVGHCSILIVITALLLLIDTKLRFALEQTGSTRTRQWIDISIEQSNERNYKLVVVCRTHSFGKKGNSKSLFFLIILNMKSFIPQISLQTFLVHLVAFPAHQMSFWY